MALFTIILDYAGGTYIAQVKARSPHSAIHKWALALDFSQIHGLGSKGKEDLIAEVKSEKPTQVNSTKNVWCYSSLVRGKLGLINLVKTVEKIR